MGACNVQILPRLTEGVDAEMEKWNHSLLLLQKLFKQTVHEMLYYNSMERVIYNNEVIRKAMGLIDESGEVPDSVQRLFDHWKINQNGISFACWAIEASQHHESDELVDLLQNFLDLKTGRHDLTITMKIFQKLRHFCDLNGKLRFIKSTSDSEVTIGEPSRQIHGDDPDHLSWRCTSCWFQNGIQKVGGVWRRLCDFHECGLCGAPKSGTVMMRVNAADSARDVLSSSISSIDEQKDQDEQAGTEDPTPFLPSTDNIIEKCAQNVSQYLSCSAEEATELCPDIRQMAVMLLKHRRYCDIVDHGKDAELEADELVKYCDVRSYKSAVLMHVVPYLLALDRKRILKTLEQHLDQNTDKICEFGVFFGFKGQHRKFKNFLRKYGGVKPGHATNVFRKVRLEVARICLENWMKENAFLAQQCYDHILEKHLARSTEPYRDAIYDFFRSVVHHNDDEKLRNQCLDRRKLLRIDHEDKDCVRRFDDFHSELCHHQTVEEIWNGLINPLKKMDVQEIKQLLRQHYFKETEAIPKLNDVKDEVPEVVTDKKKMYDTGNVEERDKFDDDTLSLLFAAIEKCKIDGKLFLSASSDVISKKVTKYFESVEDIQTHLQSEKRREDMMEMWSSAESALETFNFQKWCSVHKREGGIEENDYGYAQVHWLFKRHFVLEGVVCADPNSLVEFAKDHVPEFRDGIPGAFREAVTSYCNARDADERSSEVDALTLQTVYAEKVEECSPEELITLFTFEASNSEDDEKKDSGTRLDDGVFRRFERIGGRNVLQMRQIDDWKQKIVEWIKREKINGKLLGRVAMVRALSSNDINVPHRGADIQAQYTNKQLNHPCRILMRICKESPVSYILKAAEAQKLPRCLVMQRLQFILKRFHSKTFELGDNGFYEDGIRHFVGNLPEYGLEKLQNDIEHILSHKWKGRQCLEGRECIHSQRALRDRQQPQSQDIEQKKKFFRTKSPADFVAISMLDRLHCIMHHEGDMIRGDETNELELFQAFKKDAYSTNMRENYPVYDSGHFVDYSSLKPLHQNLKEEMLNNRLCQIKGHQFDEHLRLSQLALAANSKSSIKKRRAWKSDEANDIRINDEPRIEHVLCIKMYCNDTVLCKEFCNSYRSIKGQQDNESEDVTQNHVDNFYWFGRYLSCAIELFGDEATTRKTFYRGLNKPFLFNHFSAVYEVPLSTTYVLSVAHQFATESGVILCLSPKYKNEINISRYLDVGAQGLSEFDNEKERLVKFYGN